MPPYPWFFFLTHSEILSGRRRLNTRHIGVLSRYFRVSPALNSGSAGASPSREGCNARRSPTGRASHPPTAAQQELRPPENGTEGNATLANWVGKRPSEPDNAAAVRNNRPPRSAERHLARIAPGLELEHLALVLRFIRCELSPICLSCLSLDQGALLRLNWQFVDSLEPLTVIGPGRGTARCKQGDSTSITSS